MILLLAEQCISRLDLSIHTFYGVISALLDLISQEISSVGCKGLRYIDGLLIFKLPCLYEIIKQDRRELNCNKLQQEIFYFLCIQN